jgi:hypothetical protein
MVAAALRELLPDILQDLRVWMSDQDIQAGQQWSPEISKQLAISQAGIICLTPENLTSPWLLFEAGALANKVAESRVIPYRLGLAATEVEFPLAQFQSVGADDSGTLEMLASLNRFKTDPFSSERLERVHRQWWPKIEARLAAVPANDSSTARVRTERSLLEEILSRVRNPQNIPLSPHPTIYMATDQRQIAVGETATVQLAITNPTAMNLHHVNVVVMCPRGLRPISSDLGRVDEQTVKLPTRPTLPPNELYRFSIRVKAVAAGIQEMTAICTEDILESPLVQRAFIYVQ